MDICALLRNAWTPAAASRHTPAPSRPNPFTNTEETMPVTRINPGPRMSQAVIHGNTVYLAGQVAANPTPSVKEQTQQILAQIDALLQQAGTDKSKLVSTNIWLTDIRNFAEMNAVWDAWVSPGNTPARATVQATLANPSLLVEIMVVAAKD
jgi:enamine deaminase RidA (YjgF/YER057c/UK114 family)